jgi:uncharacterized damage-inducible protein DinB
MPASPLAAHFAMLARYNAVANARLYEVCGQLSDDEYRKERAGSFRSIHRTLNHILLGDRIWMDRFARAGQTTTPKLNQILYDDFPALRAAREAEDSRIEEFMLAMSDAFLAQEFEYVNNAGVLCVDPATVVMTHLFNHQTHHRGQIHVMLSQAGVQPPNLDLHRAIRPV